MDRMIEHIAAHRVVPLIHKKSRCLCVTQLLQLDTQFTCLFSKKLTETKKTRFRNFEKISSRKSGTVSGLSCITCAMTGYRHFQTVVQKKVVSYKKKLQFCFCKNKIARSSKSKKLNVTPRSKNWLAKN